MFEQYKQYGECDSTHFCMTQRVMAILSEAGASLPYSMHSFATMCIYSRRLSCGHGTTRRSDWYCTEEHRAPLFTPPTNNPLLTSYFQYGGICTSLTLSYRKGTVQLFCGRVPLLHSFEQHQCRVVLVFNKCNPYHPTLYSTGSQICFIGYPCFIESFWYLLALKFCCCQSIARILDISLYPFVGYSRLLKNSLCRMDLYVMGTQECESYAVVPSTTPVVVFTFFFFFFIF